MSKKIDEILRLKDAAYYIGVSTTTLWRLDKSDETFPKKVNLTKRCAGYRKSELDDWIESKSA